MSCLTVKCFYSISRKKVFLESFELILLDEDNDAYIGRFKRKILFLIVQKNFFYLKFTYQLIFFQNLLSKLKNILESNKVMAFFVEKNEI